MGFCPVPHKLRDQVWLVLGLLVGVYLSRWRRNRQEGRLKQLEDAKKKELANGNGHGEEEKGSSSPTPPSEPNLVEAPIRLVDLPERKIDEFFAMRSSGKEVSVARVKVTKKLEERYQGPTQFDEYIVVLSGLLQVQVPSPGTGSSGSPSLLEARKSQGLFLPKGREYHFKFPEGDCEYMPIRVAPARSAF